MAEPSSEPLQLSIAELRGSLASGDVTPRSVVEASLERIEAVAPALNAFVSARPEVLTELDPEAEGPLAGVPVALKDVFVLDDRAPTMGSHVHADWLRGTAEVVRRLRAAGAALVGFANLHEWAIGTTSIETATGPIRNPWDPEHVAGGSSGGSAAALAAGIVPAALGTDRGGSIRVPAACCGVVGLKPTWGLVPTDGYAGGDSELDHIGPMARSVADVRALLEVLAPGDYSAPEVAGLRIGVPDSYFFDDLEDEVGLVVQAAVTILGRHHRLRPAEVTGLEQARRVVSVLGLAQAAELLGETLQERYDEFQPETAQVLTLGAEMSEEDRAQAGEARDLLRAGWAAAFEDVDVVVTPTLPALPALISEKTVELPSGVASADLAYIGLNAPMNLAGLPCVSVPCGATLEGWSVGLSITAAPGGDALVLALAEALEDELDRAFVNRIAPRAT